ncbi:MAG: cyclic nucleotide-binding domain-containing protein [Chloroflexota bacterium]
MELEAQLASVPLLAGLDDRVRRRLAQIGKRRTYAAGETIVEEGEKGVALYVILSGRVRVERSGEALGELGPGDFFGELALIEDEPRSATVIAVDETECILFVAWEFRALIKEQPQVAVPIMLALIERLHRRERHGS